MAEIDVLKAQLVRLDVSYPWGFRFEGGAESGRPLKIVSIRAGGPADKIGLREGDEVTEIGDVPCVGMSHDDANTIISQYGLCLVLTVERRARGALSSPSHHQPVVDFSHGPAQIPQAYQPYDMTQPPVHMELPHGALNKNYQTVNARTYEEPPHVGPLRPGPPLLQPLPPPQPYIPHMSNQMTGPAAHMHYSPEEDKLELDAQQSKTFKLLQSLMSNEEPYAGPQGMPPPRSASMEQWKREQIEKHQAPPRVKVFMPMEYNTPMGLYSAENIMDTFQSQAEVQLATMDHQQQGARAMTSTQQAVFEDDNYHSHRMLTSDL
jgi:hypothetical protein